jgi:hypothetical protein
VADIQVLLHPAISLLQYATKRNQYVFTYMKLGRQNITVVTANQIPFKSKMFPTSGLK